MARLFDEKKWGTLLEILSCAIVTEDRLRSFICNDDTQYKNEVRAIENFIDDSIQTALAEKEKELAEAKLKAVEEFAEKILSGIRDFRGAEVVIKEELSALREKEAK